MPRWAWGLIGLFGLVVIVALIFRWDWLIPIVESRASAALGRPVTITHLHVALGRVTTVRAEGVRVQNPQGFPDNPPLAALGQLTITANAWDYLRNRATLVIPSVVVDSPDVQVIQTTDGQANYKFAPGGGGNTGNTSGGTDVKLGDLVINDGHAHVVMPKLKADFAGIIATRQPEGKPAEIVVDAKGTYAGQPITAGFVGGALLSLRDSSQPYPVDLRVANGPTRVTAAGTIEDPQHLKGMAVKISFTGPDMAQLEPLTGIPFPTTAAFQLTGSLDYQAPGKVAMKDFAGRVGQTDLEGTIAVDPGAQRPMVTADLASRQVRLDDLGGFIGSKPGSSKDAGETPRQRREIAQAEASPKLLPTTPVSVPKLNAADVALRYHADHIEGKSMPFDTLSVAMDIRDGDIDIHPAKFTVGRGNIAANVSLAQRLNQSLHVKSDIDFRQVEIAKLLKTIPGSFEGAGVVGGNATLDTEGRSFADWLGHGNGDLKLFTSGGNLSAILVALSGLQFGNAVISALGIPSKTELRCMIVDMPLQRGVFTTKVFIIDTDQSNINVAGNIDLDHERLDLQIKTEAKHFSIGSLPAPIDITGTLKDPSIGPDAGSLAVRGGAALALGALLTPVGALLPTIQLGLGEDNDCAKLIHDTASTGANKLSPAELRRRAGHG